MYQLLIKKGPSFAFLAAVVLIVIALIPILSGMEALSSLPAAQQAYAPEGNIFLTALYITAALFILAVAAAILLSLFNVVSNPKGAMKGLMSFAIIAGLFLVFYFVADAKASGSLAQTIETFQISDTVSKVIGSGIRVTFLLGAGSVLLIVFMEIWNYFKNQ